MSVIAFSFGSFNLQASGVTTIAASVLNSAENKADLTSLAHSDGGVVTQQLLQPKTETLTLMVKADSQASLQSAIDAMKMQTLLAGKQQLIYQVPGLNARAAEAYCTNFAESGSAFLTQAKVTLTFTLPRGVYADSQTRSFVNATVTTSPFTATVPLLGSYKVEPSFTLQLNSFAGGSSNYIRIVDGSTLLGVTVTRTWQASDTLFIDCDNQIAQVNGIDVDIGGTFPVWSTNSASLRVTDGFTSRSMALASSYVPRFA